MLTAKVSTKGQIVVPQQVRNRSHLRAGDVLEFLEGDEPDVIIMRKVTRRANQGLVDVLCSPPHRFELPARRAEYPKKPTL